MSLVMGRGWATEITGRDREQSRDKKFWGKKMGLSQNKKCARANRELQYQKVKKRDKWNYWETKKCQVLQAVLETEGGKRVVQT